MGKGSSPRPVDATKYRENWDRIFAKLRDADRQQREALDELTQLSQDMGMYPPIDDPRTAHE